MAFLDVSEVFLKLHMENPNNHITSIIGSLARFKSDRLCDLRPICIASESGEFVRRTLGTTDGHTIMIILLHVSFDADMCSRQHLIHTDISSIGRSLAYSSRNTLVCLTTKQVFVEEKEAEFIVFNT